MTTRRTNSLSISATTPELAAAGALAKLAAITSGITYPDAAIKRVRPEPQTGSAPKARAQRDALARGWAITWVVTYTYDYDKSLADFTAEMDRLARPSTGCECGCGGTPKGKTSRFLPGHDMRKGH